MDNLQVIYEVMMPEDNIKPLPIRSKRRNQWKNLPFKTDDEGNPIDDIPDVDKFGQAISMHPGSKSSTPQLPEEKPKLSFFDIVMKKKDREEPDEDQKRLEEEEEKSKHPNYHLIGKNEHSRKEFYRDQMFYEKAVWHDTDYKKDPERYKCMI